MVDQTLNFHERVSAKQFVPVQAVSSGENDVEVSSSDYEGFSIITTSKNEVNKLKISVEVSGTRTREIFDDVVVAAQPIPGFRGVKGGNTPDGLCYSFLPARQADPKNLSYSDTERHSLEVLGPSKVYKEVIKKVINSTISEYDEKEGLSVSKNLRVEQSFEDLEATFKPGDSFRFDATFQCRESN